VLDRHERATVLLPLHAPRRDDEKDIMAVESPCIGICKFDEKTGLCIGCLRTKDECKQWKKMKDKHRVRIIDERPERKARLKKHKKK
jgi:uncharacterized protein